MEYKDKLIGKTIYKIYMNELYLVFITAPDNSEVVAFGVWGDCCSHSYFHDFIGVKNILGKKVVEFKRIGLEGPEHSSNYNTREEMTKEGLPITPGHFHLFVFSEDGKTFNADGNYELEDEYAVQYYGYKIIVDDGQSAVFAFRNSSNGYYGGEMGLLHSATENPIPDEKYRLENDYLGD